MNSADPTPEELAAALTVYTAQADYDHAELAAIVGAYLPSTLAKILKANPELAPILNNEPALVAKWSTYLKEEDFFAETIESLNHQPDSNVTVLDQFLGRNFFRLYENAINKEEKATYLDQACDRGLFAALTERCDLNLAKIKADAPDEVMARLQLLTDINKLSNSYWLAGTVHSIILLMDVGNFYSQQKDERASLARPTLEAAYEFYLVATKLVNLPVIAPDSVGNRISDYIYEGKQLKKVVRDENFIANAHAFFTSLNISKKDDEKIQKDAAKRYPYSPSK